MTPDGRLLASAGYVRDAPTADEMKAAERRIWVWDADTGECLRELEVENAPVYWLDLSPDGKQLVAGFRISSEEPAVALFDIDSGEELLRLTDFEHDMVRVQFSADGKQLHVSEREGAVSAWEAATGKRLFVCQPPRPAKDPGSQLEEYAREGVLSPDGRLVVWRMRRYYPHDLDGLKFDLGGIGPDTPVLRVYEAATGKSLYKKERASASFELIRFSPDGKQFAATRGGLTIWEAATGKEVASLKGVPDAGDFALSADGSLAVVEHADGRLRLWDVKSGKRLHDLCWFYNVGWRNRCLGLVFSADGKRLLVPGETTLRLWDVASGRELLPAPGHRDAVDHLAFSADGKTLVSRGADGVCRWDVSRAKETDRFVLGQERAKEDRIVAHSSDGRLFLDQAEASLIRFRGRPYLDETKEGQYRIRDTTTGRVLHELAGKCRVNEWGNWRRFSIVRGLFSPDGAVLLAYERQGAAGDIYDVGSGNRLARVPLSNAGTLPVFAEDGRMLAFADMNHTIHLHDTTNGREVRTLTPRHIFGPHPRGPGMIVFSPDGSHVASAPGQPRRDGTPVPLRVFHVPTGRETARFHAHPEDEDRDTRVTAMALSPDNRLLAVGVDGTWVVHLIEIASGKTRIVLTGHRGEVRSLAFSPDGRTLASGGADNVIFLWDATGARTRKPTRPQSEKQLAACWNDLASADAPRAAQALTTLIRAPQAGVALLAERVRPTPAVDRKRLARLIADLDADTFAAREAANEELWTLGQRAEAALRQALKDNPSAEAKRRIDELLDRLDRHVPSSEALRGARAVEALEHIGTPEARKCLQSLAGGDPNARLTRDAKASLKRLDRP
jgi:WD40 repeat protein